MRPVPHGFRFFFDSFQNSRNRQLTPVSWFPFFIRRLSSVVLPQKIPSDVSAPPLVVPGDQCFFPAFSSSFQTIFFSPKEPGVALGVWFFFYFENGLFFKLALVIFAHTFHSPPPGI